MSILDTSRAILSWQATIRRSESVPGEASNLFYTWRTAGQRVSSTPANEPFYRSTNGGATWTAVPNVLDVFTFGFGAAAPGQSYPAIYIVGYVNNVYGIWQSTNNAQSWTNIGTYPTGELDQITTISGDPNNYGEVYVGFAGGGYAYLSASASGGSSPPTSGSGGSSPPTSGSGGSSPVDSPVTVAYYLANQAALDANGNVVIADTAANVSTNIDALNADADVTSITLTDAGTPTLTLTVAQALDDTQALGAITNASYAISIADTAANVSANIDALNADADVTSIALTDAGTPTLTLTAAQASSDGKALGEITSPYTITISDTAANIEELTATQIAGLGNLHVTQIAASDTGVALTVAQAAALESGSIQVSAPAGSLVTVSDTAANLEALTATQILGLSGIGVAGLNSDNANVTFSASQTSAIVTANLTVSAPGTDSVTETFTDGAKIVSSNLGSSGGSLSLSTNSNGLTVNVGTSALSVTAGTETIPLNPDATESINATSGGRDSFVFSPNFGTDTILGFDAKGSRHDVIEFETSMFSYLTSGMSQAQDLAAVLSHATSSGGTTTIYNSMGDSLALSKVSVATLQANPADFKFV